MSGGILALVLALSFANATAGPSRSETEIRQLISRWGAAFRARDLDGVMAVYAPGAEFVGFDISPPLQYSGEEAYRESYRTFFAQYDGPLTVEYRDVKIESGGNIALYHALERLTGTLKSGERSSIWVRVTCGLRRIDGAWRIIHDHLSVPVDFNTGKALLDLTP